MYADNNNTVLKNVRYILLVLSMLILQACGDSKDLGDLQAFTKSVREAEKPKVDPLPELIPVEAFEYNASTIGSPFSIENVIPEVTDESTVEVDAILPDQNRQRQALEYFPLDSLKMVGTLSQKNRVYEIIFAPDETVHRVSIGNYAGTQLGQVIEVSEAETVLEETVRSRNGQWEKRKVSIALTE